MTFKKGDYVKLSELGVANLGPKQHTTGVVVGFSLKYPTCMYVIPQGQKYRVCYSKDFWESARTSLWTKNISGVPDETIRTMPWSKWRCTYCQSNITHICYVADGVPGKYCAQQHLRIVECWVNKSKLKAAAQ